MKIFRISIFFIIFFLLLRFSFLVRTVDCQIDDGFLEPGICQKIENSWKSKSLFFTDFFEDEIWLNLATSQEYGQSYQLEDIKRVLPSKLVIKLNRRLPSYRLKINDQSYLLCQNNILKQDQTDLEVLTIETEMTDLIDKNILKESYHQKFSNFVQAVKDNEINLRRVVWKNKTEIVLETNKYLKIILDEEEDFDYQMERLSLVLRDPSLEETLKEKNYLDLRFKLPVLKD